MMGAATAVVIGPNVPGVVGRDCGPDTGWELVSGPRGELIY
jgi:hypothetical protein